MSRQKSQSDSSFSTSKRDERQIKHSLLLSRLRTSSTSDRRASRSRISKTRPQRRKRPPNKLVANLESLADALPEDIVASRFDSSTRPSTSISSSAASKRQAILSTAQSIKARPGMRRRKVMIETAERDRYRRNLAATRQSAATIEDPTDMTHLGLAESIGARSGLHTVDDVAVRAAKWEALRQHIANNGR